MPGLIEELKRRNVFRVGVAYLALAWLVIQVTDIAIPALNLPEELNSIVFYIGLVGFPFALFFAWAFELTPEGVRREEEIEAADSIHQTTRHRLNQFIIAALCLVLFFVVIERHVLEELGSGETEVASVSELPTTIPETSTPGTPDVRAIAVLPFRNRSAVADDSYFVDGIHDDILTLLTRVSAFDRVISRTSVERYRDTTRPIPEIAAELGVTTILEGGVQRAGDRVRINMQLIDAANDEHLWAETYDRELTAENLFAIQSEVATAVVSALEASLSQEEEAQLEPAPPASLAALEQYFLGKQKARRRAEGDRQAAIKHFEKAVQLDPDFALGWAHLGVRYMIMGFHNAEVRKHYLDKSFEAVERALELNPRLGEAYLAKGNLYYMLDTPEAADQAYQQAAELIPNSPDLYYSLGALRYMQGRLEESVSFHRMAQERGGLDYIGSSGSALLLLGRHEEARDMFRQAIDHMPESPSGYSGMAASFWLQGRLAEAVPWTRRASDINPGDILNFHLNLAHTMLFWDLVDDDEAFCWAERHLQLYPEGFAEHELMMLAWLVRGDRDMALEVANRARELMMSNAMPVGIHPYTLALLRDEALAAGKSADIRQAYETMYPQVFESRRPDMNFAILGPAADVIPVLRATGDGDWAEELALHALEFIGNDVSMGGVFAADFLVMLGEYDKAIEALRQFAQLGGYWRIGIEFNSNLAPLHDREDYQGIIESLREHADTQRAKLRETEKPEDTCRANFE